MDLNLVQNSGLKQVLGPNPTDGVKEMRPGQIRDP